MLSEQQRKNVTDICLSLIILLVGLEYTLYINKAIDIGLNDESNYLSQGVYNTYYTNFMAPIYGAWYKFLSIFKSDPVKIYFLNYKLMTILPSVALFIAIRAYGGNRVIALTISLWFLISAANVPVWPKVSHFVVITILTGLICATAVKNYSTKFAILALTGLAAAYVRPEFFVSAIVFLAIFFVSVFFQRKTKNSFQLLISSAVTIAIFIAALYHWGSPIGGDDRALLAFKQHYALNRIDDHKDLRSPWTDHEIIIERDFGNISSVKQALLNNPPLFASHILTNIINAPVEFFRLFFAKVPDKSTLTIFFILGLLLISISLWQASRNSHEKLHKNFAGALKEKIQSQWFLCTGLLVFLLPVIFSIMAIYPRNHYLLIMGVLVMLGFALLCSSSNKSSLDTAKTSLLICGLTLMLIQPVSLLRGKKQDNLETINFIRSFKINRPVNMLEAEGGFNIYTGQNYKRIAQYDKATSWDEFQKENNIDLIIVSKKLLQDSRFLNDRQWQAFLDNPESLGFHRFEIPNTDGRSLLLKENKVDK